VEGSFFVSGAAFGGLKAAPETTLNERCKREACRKTQLLRNPVLTTG